MFASTVSHFRMAVHDTPGGSAWAFDRATHASAWQGVAGAQSASVVHASSEITGLQSEHPQSGAGTRVSFGGADFPVGSSGGPASPRAAPTFAELPSDGVGAATWDGPPQAEAAVPTHAKKDSAIRYLWRCVRRVGVRAIPQPLPRTWGLGHALYMANGHTHHGGMSDGKKKDMLSEVTEGLGSLLKRAKAAADAVPTQKIEEVVLSSAHKVSEAAKHASEKVPLAAVESAVVTSAKAVGSAAKSAAAMVPTEKIEGVVASGAREVGRAFENVATTLQREVLGSTPDITHEELRADAPPEAKASEAPPPAEAKTSEAPPPAEAKASEVVAAPTSASDAPSVPTPEAPSETGVRVDVSAGTPGPDNPHEGL